MRHAARQLLHDLRWALDLRVLPPRVAVVQLRSRLLARRCHDAFSLASATRPRQLAKLLELAEGRRHVIELGTGTAWTTVALALADPVRQVVSFDPAVRPERDGYLGLAGSAARGRIELVEASGAAGPRSEQQVDLLYIDSSHQREDTIAELAAWTPVLAPDALVVFDDYGHRDYPGVREAVQELGLSGRQDGNMFIHRRG